MWQLWNWLFGWHYVVIEKGINTEVRRVEADADGEPYVLSWGYIVDLKTTTKKWRPLTFERSMITGERDARP